MIPFMKAKWITLFISIVLIAGSLGYTSSVLGGFNLGIDFAGGIKLELRADDKLSVESLRAFFDKINTKVSVQSAGKGLQNLLKIEMGAGQEEALEKQAEKKKAELEDKELSVNSVDLLRLMMAREFYNGDIAGVKFVSTSHVGPTIGEHLKESAVNVLSIALILIIIYVAFRFKFNFAAGAMLALIHDLLLTMGIVGYLQVPLSVPVIAALLTILGYSINDTIVIYDRIRENMRTREGAGFERIIDMSINESLSRTIVTSVTTLVAVISVYLLGGDTLSDMAEVLIIGIIVGTYSSSFIASPVVAIWDKLAKRS